MEKITQKEEARRIARLLNAWADEKTLQQAGDSGEWNDYTDIFAPIIVSSPDWRIKPEPRRMWTSSATTARTENEAEAEEWRKCGHNMIEWQEVVK